MLNFLINWAVGLKFLEDYLKKEQPEESVETGAAYGHRIKQLMGLKALDTNVI